MEVVGEDGREGEGKLELSREEEGTGESVGRISKTSTRSRRCLPLF